MLNSKISEGDVITVKTTAGEEIVAKFVEETESSFIVSKPMVLVPNGQSIGLMPYVFTIGDLSKVPLRKTAFVIGPSKTIQEISDQYSTMTSGIQRATTMPEGGLVS